MSKGATMVISGALPFPSARATVRTATTVGPSAWTQLVPVPRAGRTGVWVWNSSATLLVGVAWRSAGSGSPTGSSLADGDLALAPRQAVYLTLGPGVDLFAMHAGGTEPTAVVVANEVARS